MKLNELLENTEPKEEPKENIESVWEQIKSNSASYIASTVFDVRFDEDTKKYHVFEIKGQKRVKYALMDKQEFDDTFTVVNPNIKPDAEGFTQYHLSDTIEAAQYKGGAKYISIGTKEVKINNGDYVTRSLVDKKEMFAVESKAFFTKTFKKV